MSTVQVDREPKFRVYCSKNINPSRHWSFMHTFALIRIQITAPGELWAWLFSSSLSRLPLSISFDRRFFWGVGAVSAQTAYRLQIECCYSTMWIYRFCVCLMRLHLSISSNGVGFFSSATTHFLIRWHSFRRTLSVISCAEYGKKIVAAAAAVVVGSMRWAYDVWWHSAAGKKFTTLVKSNGWSDHLYYVHNKTCEKSKGKSNRHNR